MSHLYQNLNRPEGHWVRDLLLLLLLFGTIFLAGLGKAPLIDPDEGRYAEIPREMMAAGDFITPTLNYVKYFEKPPMLYWANAASMSLLGKNEFAARLPSALAGLFTLIIVYLAGRKFYNRRTGLISSVILGTSAGFIMQSRIIITDMLLTLFLSMALFSFMMAVRRSTSSKKLWFGFFFAASAIAMLTKGLIGILIPGMIIFWYLLISKQWKLLLKIPWISGLLVFAAIASPWFVAVSQKNPEFLHFFFIHEHFQRFTSTVHGRYQPFWYFIPVILGILFPWFTQIPSAIYSGWKRWKSSNENPDLFLILWFALPFLFFSISSSKLVPYMLPVCPPLAILVASRFSSAIEKDPDRIRKSSLMASGLLVIMGALFLLFAFLPVFQAKASQFLPIQISGFINFYRPFFGFSIVSVLGAALLLQGALLTAITIRTVQYPVVVILITALSGITLTFATRTVYEKAIAPGASSKSFAMVINREIRAGDQVAALGYEQGINFYTGKRVILVLDKGELDFGSRQGDHSAWFMDPHRFMSLWLSEQRIFCVSDNVVLKMFPLIFKESQIIARRGDRVLLLNRP